MSHFFGFIPSAQLLADIQHAQTLRNSTEPLYPLRNKISMQMSDEIIDNILAQVVHHLPASDKKDHAEKLVGYVQSTIHVLFKQLLGKTSNDKLLASLDFIEKSLYQDENQQWRVGAPMQPQLTAQLHQSYQSILSDNPSPEIYQTLVHQYKQLVDGLLQHFMTDFHQTLDLGFVKRKASEVTNAAVKKAIHVAIDRIIPNLSPDESKILAQQHNALLHHTPENG